LGGLFAAHEAGQFTDRSSNRRRSFDKNAVFIFNLIWFLGHMPRILVKNPIREQIGSCRQA
jgi:hypothetical protein